MRAAVVEKGNSLASAFHATRARLAEIRQQADQDVRAAVNTVNDLAATVAQLNQQIRLAENKGGNSSDLVDQRTEAINQIAELTGARSTTNADGTVSLTLGDGQALVYSDQVTQQFSDIAGHQTADEDPEPQHEQWPGSGQQRPTLPWPSMLAKQDVPEQHPDQADHRNHQRNVLGGRNEAEPQATGLN